MAKVFHRLQEIIQVNCDTKIGVVHRQSRKPTYTNRILCISSLSKKIKTHSVRKLFILRYQYNYHECIHVYIRDYKPLIFSTLRR